MWRVWWRARWPGDQGSWQLTVQLTANCSSFQLSQPHQTPDLGTNTLVCMVTASSPHSTRYLTITTLLPNTPTICLSNHLSISTHHHHLDVGLKTLMVPWWYDCLEKNDFNYATFIEYFIWQMVYPVDIQWVCNTGAPSAQPSGDVTK